MKTISSILLLSILPIALYAQPGTPTDVQFALQRIERGLQSGSPGQFEDLTQSGITMRLEDSLYQNCSSVEALKALKSFFANKKSLKFAFTAHGTGTLSFSQNGETKSTSVDVWISQYRDGLRIWALNISNYPTATMFLDLPRK